MEAHDLLSYGVYPIGAYLVGAIPFGYLAGRAKGVDVRRLGSGNIGATNVGRVLGRPYGVAVFVLDAAKGFAPAACAGWVLGGAAPLVPVLAGFAAILGHLFPVYLRFRGGKGVATAAGVLAALAPSTTLVALAVWAGVLAAFRIVSLASMVAAVALPVAFGLLDPRAFAERAPVFWFCVATGILVVVRHRANLARLRAGTEPRIGEGKK